MLGTELYLVTCNQHTSQSNNEQPVVQTCTVFYKREWENSGKNHANLHIYTYIFYIFNNRSLTISEFKIPNLRNFRKILETEVTLNERRSQSESADIPGAIGMSIELHIGVANHSRGSIRETVYWLSSYFNLIACDQTRKCINTFFFNTPNKNCRRFEWNEVNKRSKKY